MTLELETMRKELKLLFAVPPDNPRWQSSQLLDLPVVQQVAKRLSLLRSQHSLALAIALLQVESERLVPGGPEAPLDAWRLVVAPEINFVSELRAYAAGMLIDAAITGFPPEVLRAAAECRPYSAEDFAALSGAQREAILSRSLNALWGWKTQARVELTAADATWQQLFRTLSQPEAFSRDVIYENRRKFRDRLAAILHGGLELTVPQRQESSQIAITNTPPGPDEVAQMHFAASNPPVLIQSTSGPTTRDTEPPTDFVPLSGWIAAGFSDATDGRSVLAEKSRWLAQNLAAISLGLEPGPEPTNRLIPQNIATGLRRTGAERGTAQGDMVIDVLLQAGILRQGDGCMRFGQPELADFFAAEHATQYGVHWASLHPDFERVLRWTSAILARRQDDQRNRMFFSDLRRALRLVSPVGWLDIASCLAEFRRFETPGVQVLLAETVTELEQIKRNALPRMRKMIDSRLMNLGISIPAPIDSSAFDTEKTHEKLDVVEICGGSIFDSDKTMSANRPTSNRRVGDVIEQMLRASSSAEQLECATLLLAADLSTRVQLRASLAVAGRNPFLTGFDVIAEAVTSAQLDDFTRDLACKILAREDALLRLWDGPAEYGPLVMELELMLGRRLWFDRSREQWVAVEHAVVNVRHG